MTHLAITRLVILATLAAPAGCDAPTAATPSSIEPSPSASVAVANPTSLAGCWDAVIELPWSAGETTGELCLVEESRVWSGRFFLKEKWRELESLKISETRVEFAIDTPMGSATFDADVEEAALVGTANGKFGERPFRATRK